MKLNILLPSLKEQKKASYKRCLCRVYNYIEDLNTYTPMLMEALHLSLWCYTN